MIPLKKDLVYVKKSSFAAMKCRLILENLYSLFYKKNYNMNKINRRYTPTTSKKITQIKDQSQVIFCKCKGFIFVNFIIKI